MWPNLGFLSQKGWHQHRYFALPKMSNHELAGAFNKYRKANTNLNAVWTAIGPYTPQCVYRLFSTMHHPVKQSAMIRILYRKWLDSWAPVQKVVIDGDSNCFLRHVQLV